MVHIARPSCGQSCSLKRQFPRICPSIDSELLSRFLFRRCIKTGTVSEANVSFPLPLISPSIRCLCLPWRSREFSALPTSRPTARRPRPVRHTQCAVRCLYQMAMMRRPRHSPCIYARVAAASTRGRPVNIGLQPISSSSSRMRPRSSEREQCTRVTTGRIQSRTPRRWLLTSRASRVMAQGRRPLVSTGLRLCRNGRSSATLIQGRKGGLQVCTIFNIHTHICDSSNSLQRK